MDVLKAIISTLVILLKMKRLFLSLLTILLMVLFVYPLSTLILHQIPKTLVMALCIWSILAVL